jgi:hypothetical protein
MVVEEGEEPEGYSIPVDGYVASPSDGTAWGGPVEISATEGI